MLCFIGKGFSGLDLTFFLAYLAITLVIGFWVGWREKATVSDYFRAGNRLPWYAIGCSIIAAGISSEQFVGETGYAYQYGMPVANWEWLIFPAMSLFLWIFVPLYVRNNVSTMPEYLERRFGARSRTLYASLIIASYVLANFALVFYTAGFAMEQMWGVNRFVAIAIIAVATGAYTIYGGLESVAWTDFFQCALLVGGGTYVFFAGMAHPKVGWDFAKVLGDPSRAHLMGGGKDFPWTGWIILALSTNTWYYATDQFINQRCLGAKNEWHAKMGALLAIGIQIIMPLTACFPGMIYYVINPHLAQADQAYPRMVAEVVPAGLRGLVVAAVLGAVMSTVSGLVNSTSTLFTLDILRRTKGRDWSEMKLVRWGQISGTLALVLGAGFSVAVMNWQNMFRYCQDIWAPMAAPAVVVFLGGALWKGANGRGAVACLWLAILTVPITFLKQAFADRGVHFLPPSLENSMVFAGLVYMAAIALLVCLSLEVPPWKRNLYSALSIAALTLIAHVSTEAIAILVAASVLGAILILGFRAKAPQANMWDRSMLREPGVPEKWYQSLWAWWLVAGAIMAAIYIKFW